MLHEIKKTTESGHRLIYHFDFRGIDTLIETIRIQRNEGLMCYWDWFCIVTEIFKRMKVEVDSMKKH